MKPIKSIISLVVFVVLVGCVTQRAQIAKQAKSDLIGISKADLLACAGAPVRSAKSDNMEVLTYVGGGDSRGSFGAYSKKNWTTGSYSSRRRSCEVTFVLIDGLVSKVNYSGRTGGLITKGEQCAFVVENCMK